MLSALRASPSVPTEPADQPEVGFSRERVDRFVANCLRFALVRQMTHRFDRCCHGGVVSYRLSLWQRLDAANGLSIRGRP